MERKLTPRQEREMAITSRPMSDGEIAAAKQVLDRPIAAIMASHQGCLQLHDAGVRLFTQVRNMGGALQAAQQQILELRHLLARSEGVVREQGEVIQKLSNPAIENQAERIVTETTDAES